LNAKINFMKEKEFLMIPGPTPVPESILQAHAKHPIGHRSGEFSKIFMNATEKLQWLGQTKNDVFIYTASGTGAMEGAIANTINRGDKVLSLVIGVFGKRFADVAELYGAQVTRIEKEPGEAVSAEELRQALEQGPFKAVTITHSETSTGTANDIETLIPIIKKNNPDTLVLLDAITSLACMNVAIDQLEIDVCVSGSQKGFMLPPGLSFIYVSQKAYAAKENCTTPSYYFCWQQAKKALNDKTTPWTPNVSLIVALEKALEIMYSEGLENIIARHKKLRDRLRQGIRDLGLELLTADETASCAITAIWPPEGINVPDIRKSFKEDWNITVANGQRHLKDKLFRMGHLGFVCERDILTGLSALKAVLEKLGYQQNIQIKTTA
jgi:aspartate aminotransferase-like enzyme